MAEWMLKGEPEYDLIATDPGRFGKWTTDEYCMAIVRESYGAKYTVHFPNEEIAAGKQSTNNSFLITKFIIYFTNIIN